MVFDTAAEMPPAMKSTMNSRFILAWQLFSSMESYKLDLTVKVEVQGLLAA